MPGFDGSGPSGGGPMTGRGRGYCALPLSKEDGYPPVIGRREFRRFGRSRFGFGLGRGRGRRWWL